MTGRPEGSDDVDPAVAEAIGRHADSGRELGLTYLQQDHENQDDENQGDENQGEENQGDRDSGSRSALLHEAIAHLEVAVVTGVDGVVIRDPYFLQLLGYLELAAAEELSEELSARREPAEDAAQEATGDAAPDAAYDAARDAAKEAVNRADDVFAEGLDCPVLDPLLRLSLLDGLYLARCRRLALIDVAEHQFYQPGPELSTARDDLVTAAEELFLAVPADHQGADSVAVALIRALAMRMIGRTGPPEDTSSLRRLLLARPDLRQVEDAAVLVMTISQALLVAFEHEGRPDLLELAADVVAEARSWPDLPDDIGPFLTLTMASIIVNAPDDQPLAARLDEVESLIDEASSLLPPDDPHLAEADIQRIILLQRRAARSQDPAIIDEATRQIGRAALQPRAGVPGPTRAVLAGLLGGLLDTRFRRRQDLRDMRAGIELTDHAIADSESGLRRALLLGNRAVALLRTASNGDDPDAVGQALDALGLAIASVPAGSPVDYQLHGVLASALSLRAQTEHGPRQIATLRQAWDAASHAAEAEAPHPQALLAQVALSAALGESDPAIRSAGEQALGKLAELRSSRSGQQLPTEQLDMALSMVSSFLAMRPGVSPEVLDAALAEVEPLINMAGYPDQAGQLLGMQQARMLRFRDNLRWRQSLQAYNERPSGPDVQRRQLLDWLLQGGSDITQIRTIMAEGLVEHVRTSFDRQRSRQIGVQVLAGHAARVLLQSGTQDAIMTARAASRDSHEVVTWCLADGADDEAITALEAGRALTLMAAGASRLVGDLLDAVGEPDLASAWRLGQDAAEPRPGELTAPADIRHRALDQLAASARLTDVLRPSDRDDLAATLERLGYDALVYLIPRGRRVSAGIEGPPHDTGRARSGGALTVTAGGRVRWQALPELTVEPGSVIGDYLRAHQTLLTRGGAPGDNAAWRDALDEVCQWAWAAAMGPLRPALARIHPVRAARVVLVPVDALCVVPWHAAYPPGDRRLPPSERRHALDAVTFSYAASGSLLSRIARRPAPPPGASALLVGDPDGDLPAAADETRALRDAFYPAAAMWGSPEAMTDETATPAKIRAALSRGDFSLFHYAGHATVDTAQPGRSALVMGDQRLRADRISTLEPPQGYQVCLAACTTHLAAEAFDEVFTLSTAFLLGGASTVLGSLWRMKDTRSAVLMFLVHHYLNLGSRPIDALHRAQLWMLNPSRRIPPEMPDYLRKAVGDLDLTDPVIWASLTHHGQ